MDELVSRTDLAVAIIYAARLTDHTDGLAAADAVLALLRERGEYCEKYDARWGLHQYLLVELGTAAGKELEPTSAPGRGRGAGQ